MDNKSYTYFDHDADIGIAGHGKTIESTFESAAEAMFDIMADINAIKADTEINIEFDEADIEYALVTWLNTLIAEAREHGLALGRFKIKREGIHWKGQAWGEPWREDLERGVEVKGATLTMLSVKATIDGWEACCIVDV